MAKVWHGRFFHYAEQGGGAFYAFQDEVHIHPPTEKWPYENWSYDGLHAIEDRDYIMVYNQDDSTYWEGEVRLDQGRPLFRDRWHHWLLGRRLTREQWGEIFYRERRGTLIRD